MRRDLTHLSYLNEPGILHVLRQRYSSDAVYTTAGAVGQARLALLLHWTCVCAALHRAPAHMRLCCPAPASCRPRAGGSEPFQDPAAVWR